MQGDTVHYFQGLMFFTTNVLLLLNWALYGYMARPTGQVTRWSHGLPCRAIRPRLPAGLSSHSPRFRALTNVGRGGPLPPVLRVPAPGRLPRARKHWSTQHTGSGLARPLPLTITRLITTAHAHQRRLG